MEDKIMYQRSENIDKVLEKSGELLDKPFILATPPSKGKSYEPEVYNKYIQALKDEGKLIEDNGVIMYDLNNNSLDELNRTLKFLEYYCETVKFLEDVKEKSKDLSSDCEIFECIEKVENKKKN